MLVLNFHAGIAIGIRYALKLVGRFAGRITRTDHNQRREARRIHKNTNIDTGRKRPK